MPFAMAVPFTFCIISGIKSVIFTDSFHLLLLLASCVVRVCVCIRRGKRERESQSFLYYGCSSRFCLGVSARFCAPQTPFRMRMGEKEEGAQEKRESQSCVVSCTIFLPVSCLVRKRKSTVDLAPPQPHAPHTKLPPEDMGKC